MRIAFAGNPNSGKTTMYNALTGRNEKVGNWAGVTVEKKESPIKRAFCKGEEALIAVDLPGAYSMSPFTSEESITSAYELNGKRYHYRDHCIDSRCGDLVYHSRKKERSKMRWLSGEQLFFQGNLRFLLLLQ